MVIWHRAHNGERWPRFYMPSLECHCSFYTCQTLATFWRNRLNGSMPRCVCVAFVPVWQSGEPNENEFVRPNCITMMMTAMTVERWTAAWDRQIGAFRHRCRTVMFPMDKWRTRSIIPLRCRWPFVCWSLSDTFWSERRYLADGKTGKVWTDVTFASFHWAASDLVTLFPAIRFQIENYFCNNYNCFNFFFQNFRSCVRVQQQSKAWKFDLFCVPFICF